MKKRSWAGALGSLKLTAWLIAVLAGLLLVGLVVPQRAVLTPAMYADWRRGSPRLVAALEWLQFTEIYTSWAALAVWVLFFANLLFVLWQRTPGILARVRLPGPPPRHVEARGWPAQARFEVGAPGALERAMGFFAARRYWVKSAGSRFVAVRNRWSPLATILFHGSFVLLVVGGGISVFTRFQATVRLAEGERFTGALQDYETRPSMPRWGDIPHEPFVIRSIVPTVEGNVPTGLRVDIVGPHGEAGSAEINRPYRIGNRDFVLRDLGIAPLVVVTGPDGREIDGAWVKLDVLMGKRDRFDLAGLHFEAEFFPDHALEDGEDGSRTQEFKNPVLRLGVTAPGSPPVLVRLRPGERSQVGSYAVAFADHRYWVRFRVRKEAGIPVVWTGFALACAGLVVRLGAYRREYLVEIDESGGLAVAARSEFYRSLFDEEFARTLAALAAAVEAPPGVSASSSGGGATPGVTG